MTACMPLAASSPGRSIISLRVFLTSTEALGRVIAQGTLANLQLWKVGGTLRFLDAHSNSDAVAAACPEGTA